MVQVVLDDEASYLGPSINRGELSLVRVVLIPKCRMFYILTALNYLRECSRKKRMIKKNQRKDFLTVNIYVVIKRTTLQ